MSFTHGKGTRTFINTTECSAFLNNVEQSISREMSETSVFGSAVKTYTKGLRDSTITLSGYWDGATDAEVIVLVIDAKAGLKGDVPEIIAALANRREPKLLVLNKVDICVKERLLDLASRCNELAKFEEIFFISASTGDGVTELKAALAARLPLSPWHYPEDQLSDATTRLMATELTREQLYLQLHAELPYAATVETEKWEERRDGSVAIHQQIIIERDSQKAIVLGKSGSRIKEIGATSRANIADLLGRKVHLFLHIKVRADWGDDRSLYSAVGLDFVD
jgi:GTP-binding protein Era